MIVFSLLLGAVCLFILSAHQVLLLYLVFILITTNYSQKSPKRNNI